LIAMADQDADLVYNMTKAMVDLYGEFEGKAPGINGWSIDKQDTQWVAPYHEGAIRYFKEIGKWSDEAQAHNDRLIARQAALADAWKSMDGVSDADWDATWSQKRKAALESGGFDVVF
ncbi:MAG: TAXI family TRAP transporter solute-binding subunit, partial [Pseudomonadota bacterium]